MDRKLTRMGFIPARGAGSMGSSVSVSLGRPGPRPFVVIAR